MALFVETFCFHLYAETYTMSLHKLFYHVATLALAAPQKLFLKKYSTVHFMWFVLYIFGCQKKNNSKTIITDSMSQVQHE